jgi:hypothetical protein
MREILLSTPGPTEWYLLHLRLIIETGPVYEISCMLNTVYLMQWAILNIIFTKKKLRGLSPRANYTDRAIAACRGS